MDCEKAMRRVIEAEGLGNDSAPAGSLRVTQKYPNYLEIPVFIILNRDSFYSPEYIKYILRCLGKGTFLTKQI